MNLNLNHVHMVQYGRIHFLIFLHLFLICHHFLPKQIPLDPVSMWISNLTLATIMSCMSVLVVPECWWSTELLIYNQYDFSSEYIRTWGHSQADWVNFNVPIHEHMNYMISEHLYKYKCWLAHTHALCRPSCIPVFSGLINWMYQQSFDFRQIPSSRLFVYLSFHNRW